MKVVFIVNPVAGSMTFKQKAYQIKSCMIGKIIKYKIFKTTNPSNAQELTERAIAMKADIIFAVGGDGTVNEVGSSLIGTDFTMGILPCGSGNDFAKMLKIPLNIKDALEHTLSANTNVIDSIMLNGKGFINISSIGVDADSAYVAGKLKKYFGGLSYLAALIICLAKLKYKNTEIEIDGTKTKGKFLLSAIANGSRYGGMFQIAPNASVSDGKIDVCLINKIPKLYSLVIFPTVIFGKHIKIKHVSMLRAEEVTINYSGDMAVNIDGNIFVMAAPLNFKINPKSLKIIY